MGDDDDDDPPEVRTEFQLSPEQRQLINMSMPQWMQFAAQSAPPSAAANIAPFSPAQLAGQQMTLGATGGQEDIVRNAGGASQFLTSGNALDPRTNPGLAGTIDAATRPIWQGLTESVLPSIRSGAAVSGTGAPSANYGGSRQGIAEGIASRGAATAAGDVAQKTAFQGYQSGLDAMVKAMGLSPGIASAQTIPGITTSAVGAEQQGQLQRELSANQAAQEFAWWLPFVKAQGMTAGAAATPGGTNVSTGSVPPGPSTADMIMGGATLAASLAPFVLSDMRLKADVVQIGELFDGTPVYRYRYAGNGSVHIGLMAQDVEKFAPEAVAEIGSFKMVNYDLATRRAMETRNGIRNGQST